jgi:hypothetical protein
MILGSAKVVAAPVKSRSIEAKKAAVCCCFRREIALFGRENAQNRCDGALVIAE